MNAFAGPYTKYELEQMGIEPENIFKEYYLVYLYNYPNKSLLYMTFEFMLDFISELNEKIIELNKTDMEKVVKSVYESIEMEEENES